MAGVDHLVSQVSDSRLRKELTEAIGVLKRRQRLGLVFEEHFPETDAIYGLKVHVGSLVRIRTEPDPLWRVTKIKENGRIATVSTVGDDRETSAPTKELLSVQRLGD